MSLTFIWRSLGFSWFCLLSMLTASIIVSMDYEIGSLKSALTTHFPSTVFVAILIALTAVWPLMMFKKGQWVRGMVTVSAMGIISHVVLQIWVSSSTLSTIQESLLFVVVAGICWTLIALPSALFLSRP
jgi:hypothetical protein